MIADKKTLVLIGLLIIAQAGFARVSAVKSQAAKQDSVFQVCQDSLSKLRRISLNADEQFMRFNTNEKLIDYWFETLRRKGSEKYNFNKLDSMYIVTSPDNKLRIVTWHILNDDRTHDYFGIVQAYSERHDDYVVYELHDKSDQLKKPEYEMLRNGDWFGALYYDIIQVKKSKNFIQDILGNQRTYYTLLGWNGKDFKTDLKLIEVAYLQSNGDIVLGHTLFRTRDYRLRRIMFEYSDRASMSMKYEKQYKIIEEKEKQNSSRRRRNKPEPPDVSNRSADFEAQKAEKKKKEKEPELVPEKMIIFQRLIYTRPELEGIPSQRIPHPEDYAAFIFEDGRWTYYNNIDAFNDPSKKDGYKRTYDSKQLFSP
ncbi:MAG: hypothetical protein K9I29_04065 [Bacteroidales bacterium]|nr:hypothetical protein [Bacteroidales bacterium]MCF8327447.1 hypothetical protein [Bacteroidales bacterium]